MSVLENDSQNEYISEKTIAESKATQHNEIKLSQNDYKDTSNPLPCPSHFDPLSDICRMPWSLWLLHTISEIIKHRNNLAF